VLYEQVPPDRLPADFAFPVQELRQAFTAASCGQSTIIEDIGCETWKSGPQTRQGRSIPGPPQSLGVELQRGSSITIRNPEQVWWNLPGGPIWQWEERTGSILALDVRTVNTSILG
jgi:hypothetical protein